MPVPMRSIRNEKQWGMYSPHLWHLFFLLLVAFVIPACTEEDKDPDGQTDSLREGEDISVTALVTPSGATLELEDERGTLVRVTFPPVAVSDSMDVTLHMTGEVDEQALGNRHIRSFEVLPADLLLYEPVYISLIFKDKPDSLYFNGLFRVPSGGNLQALGDLSCAASGDTLSASSVRAGFFTEGHISTDEILRQLDRILGSYDIQTKGSEKILDAGSDIAAAWGDIHADITSYLGFMEQLDDYYKDHPQEKETHEKKLCEVVCKGVERILDMPVPPGDPCQRAYVKTMGDMVKAMNLLGCTDCKAFTDVQSRFGQTMRDCKSFLETEMDFVVNYDGGSLDQHDGGLITLSARFDEYGVVVVEGSGEMVITGTMKSGDCDGLIIGTSTVFVYGFRDAAFNYTLELLAEDEGKYIISCPEGGYTQPFTSSPTEIEAELNPGNNFTWDRDYEIPGAEGTMHVYLKLFNPWVDMVDN